MKKERTSYQLGAVIQVGNTWRFRYRETDTTGKTTRPSLLIGTIDQYPTKAKAHKAAEPLRQRVNDTARVVYFKDLCDQYKGKAFPSRGSTQGPYESMLLRLRTEWGDNRVDWMASPEGIMQIEFWFRSLHTQPHTNHSVNGVRPLALKSRENLKSLMHHMFTLAMKWGHLTLHRNPIELVDLRNLPVAVRTKRKRATLTPELYRKLLQDPETPAHVRVMIELAANTGMGASEFLGLQWSDVDYKNGFFWIRRSVVARFVDDTKTVTRAGSYPMHPDLAKLMNRWQKVSPKVGDWVFGSLYTDMPYNREALYTHHLRPAGQRIGVDRLGWHSLRHFYRQIQRQLRHPMEIQKMLMRHSRIATTMQYGAADDVDRAEEVRPYNAQIVELLKTGKRKVA